MLNYYYLTRPPRRDVVFVFGSRCLLLGFSSVRLAQLYSGWGQEISI